MASGPQGASLTSSFRALLRRLTLAASATASLLGCERSAAAVTAAPGASLAGEWCELSVEVGGETQRYRGTRATELGPATTVVTTGVPYEHAPPEAEFDMPHRVVTVSCRFSAEGGYREASVFIHPRAQSVGRHPFSGLDSPPVAGLSLRGWTKRGYEGFVSGGQSGLGGVLSLDSIGLSRGELVSGEAVALLAPEHPAPLSAGVRIKVSLRFYIRL